jgi:enoyl-CoA hydratase/carnithine racemase
MDTPPLTTAGLTCSTDGPIATVTLDRPEVRNAQTPQMWEALAAWGSDLADDVRVVVVTGRGESFSAGLDRAVLDPGNPDGVGALLRMGDEEAADRIGAWQEAFTWLRDPRIVSIAKVRGHAVGAGFQLALSCDLRVVADDARFCMKESALGLVPDLTGTQPLVEAVGYARALDICVTARTVGAEEADRIGLVHSVHGAADLDAAVDDLARAFAAPMEGVAPATKALLQGAAGRDLEAQRRAERVAQVARFRAVAAAL